jgi:hypothetical protein
MAADFRPNAGEQGQSSVISLKLQVKSPGKQGEMGFSGSGKLDGRPVFMKVLGFLLPRELDTLVGTGLRWPDVNSSRKNI